MHAVMTIGFDIAKLVFQVHGVDAHGKVVVRRQLRRRQVLPFFKKLPSCLVGVEACATSHHWSRELQALGHTVRLMPPVYVKPYLKRQKNDAADAEAICEAVMRPSMRFVATKTPEQQCWWPALPIQGLSDQEEIFLLGWGWCRSRTRAAARKGLAALPSAAIDICAACSPPARSP